MAAPLMSDPNPPAPQPAPPAPPGQAPSPTAEPSPWGALPDDLKPYVEAKGWKSPLDALTSYQHLEKLHRTPADRTLVLPEKPDDAEGWAKVWDRLGRPEKPESYEFEGYEAPKDGSFDLMQGDEGFAKVAHQIGLPKQAAGALWKWYAGRLEAQGQHEQQQLAERASAGMEAVKAKWGAAFDANLGVARGAISRLGLGDELGQKALQALENHPELGTEWLLETFSAIGRALGEHQRPSVSDSGPSDNTFAVTPAQAQAKINELLGDETFRRKYFEGGQIENERITKLTQIAAGNAAVHAPIRP